MITQYPVLEPGSFAKPQITGGRFRWHEVVRDPGPPDKRDRRVELRGPRGVVRVRRDRVHTNFDPARMSEFDTVFATKPPPGFVLQEDVNFLADDELPPLPTKTRKAKK
jgi:hypothetical protein